MLCTRLSLLSLLVLLGLLLLLLLLLLLTMALSGPWLSEVNTLVSAPLPGSIGLKDTQVPVPLSNVRLVRLSVAMNSPVSLLLEMDMLFLTRLQNPLVSPLVTLLPDATTPSLRRFALTFTCTLC